MTEQPRATAVRGLLRAARTHARSLYARASSAARVAQCDTAGPSAGIHFTGITPVLSLNAPVDNLLHSDAVIDRPAGLGIGQHCTNPNAHCTALHCVALPAATLAVLLSSCGAAQPWIGPAKAYSSTLTRCATYPLQAWSVRVPRRVVHAASQSCGSPSRARQQPCRTRRRATRLVS